MASGGSTDDCIERFASVAHEYGVGVRRLKRTELRETIATVVDPPAVGVPLPYADVSLPESVAANPSVGQLETARTGVTMAAGAIASYGSLLLRAETAGSEPISLFVDLHVAVLPAEEILPDMATAFESLGPDLRETRDSVIVATGPSATADMGALVQGAHGPSRVEVLVVE